MTVRDDVLTTIALIGNDPKANEQTIVERLVAQDYEVLQAELLVAFVPLGLARVIIARLHCESLIDLPDTALIRDFTQNRTLEVNLMNIPEFVTAFQLGEETFLTGVIPREQFKAASSFSVELNLISKALYAGESIGGGEMAPPILLRLAQAPGFENWYQSLKS